MLMLLFSVLLSGCCCSFSLFVNSTGHDAPSFGDRDFNPFNARREEVELTKSMPRLAVQSSDLIIN